MNEGVVGGDYRDGCKVKQGGENAPTILKRT